MVAWGGRARTMAWAVRSCYLGIVSAVRPLGRAQLLRLRAVAGSHGAISAVGHNVPHDDDALVTHLADLSKLAADARGTSTWVVLGDGNADFSASDAAPFAAAPRAPSRAGGPPEDPPVVGAPGPLPGAAAAPARPWDAASVGASVVLPQCYDSPGGRWAAACLAAPFTRLPRGAEAAHPSCLDFVIAPRRSAVDVRVSGRLAIDDHAALVVGTSAPLRRPPARWRPRSPGVFREAVKDMVEELPPSFSPSRFRSALRGQMQRHADCRSAAERSRDRVPFVARDALARASQAVTDVERAAHRRVARGALVAEGTRRRHAAVRRIARRGGNVAPTQALHNLTGGL